MKIYVDVCEVYGSDGIPIAYNPQVEWEITSIDRLDVCELERLRERLQTVLDDGIEKAHKEYLRKKNS